MLETRPQTRVLYMSGYTDRVIVEHGILNLDCAYLQKSITPVKLLLRVREVLDMPSRIAWIAAFQKIRPTVS